MDKRQGQLHVALSLQNGGYSPGSWRHSQTERAEWNHPDYYHHLAKTAERGKFDLLFLDHTGSGEKLRSTGREPGALFEPLTLISSLISVTERIGIGASVAIATSEPYAVARTLAVLDHLSNGRTAWQPEPTEHYEPKRRQDGETGELSEEQRFLRTQEFTHVTKSLWNSWQEDALLVDKASGRFLDANKVQFIHHAGKHFKVRGPLSVPRPPQGSPVRIEQLQILADPNHVDVTGIDLLFSPQRSLREASAFYARLHKRIADAHRSSNELKVLTNLSPILGATEQEAWDKAAAYRELIHPEAGLAILSDLLGHDVAIYPLDGPLPEIPGISKAKITGKLRFITELAREEGLTIRELGRRAAELQGTQVFVGTPAQLVNWMEDWFNSYGSDGFLLQLPDLTQGLNTFVDDVVPLLQERGLFRTAYSETTLRGNLDLTASSTYISARR
ncbi:NtaA/DmoA family FMN-dependent monooxygenase [Paenibacillus sp. SI8]|uniref:NtaA/DmoA family FMN-dependent monooxygenase n=1 Tax=unclassified Paenibacillus TaxID=185978 RepID=UPI003467B1A0